MDQIIILRIWDLQWSDQQKKRLAITLYNRIIYKAVMLQGGVSNHRMPVLSAVLKRVLRSWQQGLNKTFQT